MTASARSVVRLLGSRRPIEVLNSLGGGVREVLSGAVERRLKWYSCGPTVYDDAHVGHGRAYVSLDVMRRLLERRAGVVVEYALGVTDIDDKIIQRAHERRAAPLDLARHFEARFFDDMARLNVKPPTHILRVSEHIPEIHEMIDRLERHGHAYTDTDTNARSSASMSMNMNMNTNVMNPPEHINTGVYFSIASVDQTRYYQLDQSREQQEASPSPQVPGAKRDARDFALWKTRPDQVTGEGEVPSEKSWGSPWGQGRPGWHVECSAMAINRLGSHLDVHTGGIDLRFPHHTNELATAEAYLQCCGGDAAGPEKQGREKQERWVHTWLHVGHVHIAGRKMSKSLKNFVTIREFLDGANNDNDSEESDGLTGCAATFRLFCLLHRYNSPVELDSHRIAHAKSVLRKIDAFLTLPSRTLPPQPPLHGLALTTLVAADVNMKGGASPAAQVYDAVDRLDDAVDAAVANNFDTPRLVHAVEACMDEVTGVVRAATLQGRHDPETGLGRVMLSYEYAREYMVRLLQDLGVPPRIDAAGQQLDRDSDGQKDKVMSLLLEYRAEVRRAAKQKDLGQVFQACDRVRDELQSTLNIRVSDS